MPCTSQASNFRHPRKFCLRKCKTVEPPRPRDTGGNNGPVGRSDARPGNRGRGKSLARRTRSNWSRCNGCIRPDRIDCRNCRRWSQVCTRLSAVTSISRYLCNVDNTRRDRALFSSRGNGGRGKLASRRSTGHRCICKSRMDPRSSSPTDPPSPFVRSRGIQRIRGNTGQAEEESDPSKACSSAIETR